MGSFDSTHFISLLVPLLPLLGFLGYFLYGDKLSESKIGTIASAWVLTSFVLSIILFTQVSSNGAIQVNYFDWIHAGSLKIPFAFQIDQLSTIMMLLVTGVGGLIHIYSIGYMHGDNGFSRFFAYLNLFIFFMLILVMANNYILMFAGWEGVGLCSYLLIGFWYKNPEYSAAANKAFIVNRVGDLFMLYGLYMIFKYFGTFVYADINGIAASTEATALGIITLLLFIGATGKSAQIPLHTWLPDAMAGPTPVSALIHAATMVTAGIYMIIRSNILFALAPSTNEIIVIIGLATTLIAGMIALKQNDIKKVLAYSTVSQLGLMFFALGVGAYAAAFFHLLTHAFFKALLFLGAGSVIHGMHGEQDIRKMGGLSSKMHGTHITFLIAVIAIIALPPLSGFFSKDYILASAFGKSPILWTLGAVSGLLTAFYMMRLYFLVFKGKSRVPAAIADKVHESPSVMLIPLYFLAGLSAIGGFMNIPSIFGGGRGLETFLDPVVSLSDVHIEHSTEWMLMGISTALVLSMVFWAYTKYVKNDEVPESDVTTAAMPIANILHRKFYFDEIYDTVISKPLLQLSKSLYKWVDTKIVDKLTDGFGTVTMLLSGQMRKIQNGHISFYLFAMVLGILSILTIFILL